MIFEQKGSTYMEKATLPPLSGKNVDQDTFRRVWERVMPDQTNSPISVEGTQAETQVPETAVPGEAAAAPQLTGETAPMQSQSEPQEEQPDLPQVPACSEETEGEKKECPCTGTPELCLGEGSQGDSRRLEELMSMARRGMLAGQMLSSRSCGSCARGTMRSLAADHRQALCRLSAAYFLITGKRFRPCCPHPELPSSFSLALREQFMWEQRWEHCNRQAAENTQDPCLRALYEELGQEGKLHAGTIRSLLEQMT